MELSHRIRRRRSGRALALGLVAAALTLGALLLPALSDDAVAHVQADTTRQLDFKCRKARMDARACRAAEPNLVEIPGPLHLHEIYHADGTKVGEIYVAREGDSARYVEHWVLFDAYIYPSVIKPAADQRYASERDFLARVPFGPGSTYARWDVVEQGRIPGR